jgi:hypothetical protein
MFLEEPHRTTRNYAALRERVGKDIFALGHRLEPYYLSAFALYRLEYYFRSGRIEPKLKPARHHILLAARLLASGEKPPRANENKMEKYCQPVLKKLWDIDQSDALFTEAATIITTAAEGDFHRDKIRTEPFTKKIMQHFGL